MQQLSRLSMETKKCSHTRPIASRHIRTARHCHELRAGGCRYTVLASLPNGIHITANAPDTVRIITPTFCQPPGCLTSKLIQKPNAPNNRTTW